MRRIFGLLLVALFVFTSARAQESYQVNGRLVDSIGTPLARATVGVYIVGATDTLKTVTNNVGFFLIKGIIWIAVFVALGKCN